MTDVERAALDKAAEQPREDLEQMGEPAPEPARGKRKAQTRGYLPGLRHRRGGSRLDPTHGGFPMTIYPTDKRVRYATSLAVWIVDTQESHTVGADQLLAAMTVYATESGNMPDGCTCAPESFSLSGLSGVTASPARVHRLGQQGGIAMYGHGTVPENGVAAEQGNAHQCPHADAAGERQARKLAKAGRWDDLYALTEPFPPAPGTLQPAAPGSKAPAAWQGEPLSVPGVGVIPDRHVHPATRADLARLGTLATEATRLGSEARKAQAAAAQGHMEVRRLATEAAMSGKALDAAEVARMVRERQEATEATQAVADGTRDAVDKVRREVAAGIAERRDEWLTYLHGQAAAGLARLDLVVAELEAAVENLAEIDRVRQTVEQANSGRLFSAGSMIIGNAVEAARRSRERAATALAGLERHAAKASKAKTAQKA
ncbi:hypothetical protein [Micromonospora sp. IBHARD004]|uniref:hypothetical protein n=1 Tax=Micromonospora sp. IBHARD004 TaxID=3457764 RepID=UPI004059B08F